MDAMNWRVFCTHGLPLFIVSDRGKQLISKLWERVCKHYEIKLKPFSAQHPEMDGQTEITNKFLKNYLQSYVNYMQDDWVDFLSDTEFMANDFVNEFTEMTPFFADKEYHPHSRVEPPKPYTKQERAEM